MKLKNLLQGRLGRARYFSYVLITLSVFTLLMVASRKIFGLDEQLFFIGLFLLPIILLTIRRLHDLNLNGWWILVPLASLVVASLYFLSIFPDPSPSFSQYLPLLFLGGLNVIMFLFLFFWKGTAGSNRFGEAPFG